jgi:DNA-binding response OmpR family regulator
VETKRILIIEDEENISNILRINLEMEGFEVEVARDGAQGFEVALDFRPDLITLDVLMPQRDGWDTLRDLKQDERTSAIPVVMISVMMEQKKAVDLGAQHYLVKPFLFDQVLEVIHGELVEEN